MQYLCSKCRCPLETGMTMCRCGQLFNAVPTYDPNSLSNYWPPAADSRPAAVRWLDGLSPAIKASVAGGAVLVMAIIAVGSSVHNYQRMHARYAPGQAIVVASAASVTAPAQAPTASTAPSAPPPVIMRAEPRYTPPTRRSVPYTSSQPQQGGMVDTSDPMKPTPEQMAAERRYDDASNDAMQQDNILQQRDGTGREVMGGNFGPNEKMFIGECVSRMRQDLSVMQQNFASMSPSAQATADPSTTGIASGPLTGGSAKENVQNAINKWSPYCQ